MFRSRTFEVNYVHRSSATEEDEDADTEERAAQSDHDLGIDNLSKSILLLSPPIAIHIDNPEDTVNVTTTTLTAVDNENEYDDASTSNITYTNNMSTAATAKSTEPNPDHDHHHHYHKNDDPSTAIDIIQQHQHNLLF